MAIAPADHQRVAHFTLLTTEKTTEKTNDEITEITMDSLKTITLFQKEEPKSYAAGEVIFAQGDRAEYLYGVLEGKVEMRVDGHPLEIIKAGEMFGEGALVHSDKLRSSTAVAKTDCKLAVLDEERFLFAVQETPMFAIQVMRSYSDRMRRMRMLLI